MDELSAWLLLVRAPICATQLRALLEHLPSAASIVAASPATLRAHGASGAFVDWLVAHGTIDLTADLRWLEQERHHFIPCNSPLYPPLLAEIADAPIGLFVNGDPSVLSLPQLAIVGSRNPTPVGRENAYEFAAHLARCGLAITSGFALGIDAASHRGALAAGGKTIAVCGTGLDVIYPRQHAELRAAIAASGALVSEFPTGTPPLKSHFPRRNRIISGLAVGTLVVEAAVQSGSLITARLAAEQGREVFAIPGSIHNPLARGCHRLIRQGAKLVETADDIFAELGGIVQAIAPISSPSKNENDATDGQRQLDKDYEILLDALGFEPAGVDALVARTGFKADEVASMLLILELENRIESCPGGLYVRSSTKRGS
ncbi:MAG: DNA-processing protein DprA [Gammaproteobacteria bacterium]|nr:DNA-protecting protein DprA [Gammaproteobacteria bacterium]